MCLFLIVSRSRSQSDNNDNNNNNNNSTGQNRSEDNMAGLTTNNSIDMAPKDFTTIERGVLL